MSWLYLKHLLKTFRDDERGSFTVESVIAFPLLFWTICASYEFFEVHRYKSVREKATYTIADLLSREQSVVTDTYMDNVKILFDEISNDSGTNQVRVTIVRYNETDDRYEVKWSEVRGEDRMTALTTTNTASEHDRFPIMNDGEELIVVESVSKYDSLFSLVYSDKINIDTRVFTSLRFAPKLCFDACSS
ncbi:TadE/TadG family type IV pilus assembly protein [Roseovarius sp.]|uniref:TadE/TadG family type IV pilus assembly protein n=1 Tax=Roseovarius sp. TaxID=1486281 RepID=UPI002620BDAB|nr:TadE/TadG family type IV pilus assembly protein [Roseovarius sp.]MDM8165106.1 pilus assembly protein [Roseovarius sp.]